MKKKFLLLAAIIFLNINPKNDLIKEEYIEIKEDYLRLCIKQLKNIRLTLEYLDKAIVEKSSKRYTKERIDFIIKIEKGLILPLHKNSVPALLRIIDLLIFDLTQTIKTGFKKTEPFNEEYFLAYAIRKQINLINQPS